MELHGSDCMGQTAWLRNSTTSVPVSSVPESPPLQGSIYVLQYDTVPAQPDRQLCMSHDPGWQTCDILRWTEVV